MQFTVFVRGLHVEAEVGCYAHELNRRQPLVVDVALELAAGPVERLADTADYDKIVRAAEALAAGGHIDLVETFAARLADACLALPHAARVTVRVEKPEAVARAAAAGVE